MGVHKHAKKKGILARIIEKISKWLRSLLISVLAQGEVPRHVAFIMDGNRRYAKKHHVANLAGHTAGFKTLEKILEWCMELGVKEVTVYAFSIENFKRPKEEVDGLMELTAKKMHHIMQENEMVDKLGIRVRAMGDLSLLPEHTLSAIQKVVDYSRHNTRATLNVCIAYTARDEMTRAMRKIADTAMRARELENAGQLRRAHAGDEGRVLRLVRGGLGAHVEPPAGKDGGWGEDHEEEEEKEVRRGAEARGRERGEEGKEKEGEKEKERERWGWEDEMWNAMDIDSAPELLVRTSGEIRLSDFMLWQTAFSYVMFLSVLWPNFSIFHLIYVILSYQANCKAMKEKRRFYVKNFKNTDNFTEKKKFYEEDKIRIQGKCEEWESEEEKKYV